ncbi:MAG TPA: hypothetical protein VET48_04945 [Steroidobacteraceae bacterium]|nr:hypothetical protein [Steroidobacteraceae bacterium]
MDDRPWANAEQEEELYDIFGTTIKEHIIKKKIFAKNSGGLSTRYGWNYFFRTIQSACADAERKVEQYALANNIRVMLNDEQNEWIVASVLWLLLTDGPEVHPFSRAGKVLFAFGRWMCERQAKLELEYQQEKSRDWIVAVREISKDREEGR